MSVTAKINARFRELSPGKKRTVYVGITAAALIATYMTVSTEPQKVITRHEKPTKTIFTEQNTRDIGMDSLSAKTKSLIRDNNLVDKRMEGLEKKWDSIKGTIDSSNRFDDKIKSLQQSVESLRKENISLKKQNLETKALIPDAISKLSIPVEKTGMEKDSEMPVQNPVRKRNKYPQEISDSEVNEIFQNATLPGADNTDKTGEKTGESKRLSITTYSQSNSDNKKETSGKVKKEPAYLPAGSIITGVMINGMDAPTSTQAKKNPFPSTIRIQKEAILPNRYTADIRECFMIVSGYGDLSSERVYLRGESISCITEDGSVIESRIESYAIGEDGKAGLRGRVVDKQGQIIAKSLVAGFAGSLSEAFNANPVASLTTNLTGTTPYQNVFSGKAVQAGLAKGTGKALDRIAQFYIEMAENIFPVIEVDAGRMVELILTRGATLSFKTKGNKTKSVKTK